MPGKSWVFSPAGRRELSTQRGSLERGFLSLAIGAGSSTYYQKMWREYPQLQLPIYYKRVIMQCCYSWESHYWIGESHFVYPAPLPCPLSCRVWPESCHPIQLFPVHTTSFGLLPSRACHSGCPHPTLFQQVSCIPPLATRIRSVGPIRVFPTLLSFGVASPFQYQSLFGKLSSANK